MMGGECGREGSGRCCRRELQVLMLVDISATEEKELVMLFRFFRFQFSNGYISHTHVHIHTHIYVGVHVGVCVMWAVVKVCTGWSVYGKRTAQYTSMSVRA